jgi:hypothetical protein
MSTLSARNPEVVEGVWIGVSHQTIRGTSRRADRSFSGTSFTPAMDVPARLSGKGDLLRDVPTTDYPGADAPTRKLAAKTMSSMDEITALNEANALDEKFESIRAAVDASDEVFGQGLAEEGGAYPARIEDIHKHPEDYTTPGR